MNLTASQLAIIFVAALHLLFAFGELYRWTSPLILNSVLQNNPHLHFGSEELRLVSMIVHNAGVYNFIVAAGLLATLWVGPAAKPIQAVLLLGGIVAGVFGFFTLSTATLIQVLLGMAALIVLLAT